MDLLHTVFFFLVAIGILITFHEAGHFWVARRVGAHVSTFSVGFGKRLWSRRDRRGTEFVVAALPLGGYVRFHDSREAGAEKHAPPEPGPKARSYDQLAPRERIAILLGGPGANLALAFLLYWLAAMVGMTVAPARVDVAENSPAHGAGMRAGEEVVAIDGEPIENWTDMAMALASRLGDSGRIAVETTRDGYSRRYAIPIEDWHAGAKDPDLLASLGLAPAQPPVLSRVLPGQPGERAGLAAGDRITHVDGRPISRWSEFVAAVRASADAPLAVRVAREDGARVLRMTPAAAVDEAGDAYGFVGVERIGLPTTVARQGPLEALRGAARDTWNYSLLTVRLIGKLLTLQVSPMNAAGPITIAKVSGDSARAGIGEFLSLLALLSINLGIINLLPIPVLDGGQIVLQSVELVRRKPVAEWVEAAGARVGIVLIGGLMIFVFYADFDRWLRPLVGQ